MPSPSTSALDIEQPQALLNYLRATGRIGANESPAIHNLAGGVSNRTVLVERANGQAWVLKQALAKLRVQVDWFSDPARIHREALGLLWLERLAPPGSTTPLVFEDHDQHLLAMLAVPMPHDNLKTLMLTNALSPAHLCDYIRQFGQLLGAIHRRGYEERVQLAQVFADRSFFESLRIEPYYLYTAGQVARAAGFLRDLAKRTLARRLTVVHGDYSPKNILVHQGRLILLDHEVIHWGDPAFDVGFGLTHLLSKARHLREQKAAFAAGAMEFWQAYVQALGDVPWREDMESMTVRHTLGCLLARAMGRSPLEYLDAGERDRQRDAAIALLDDVPSHVDRLVERILEQP